MCHLGLLLCVPSLRDSKPACTAILFSTMSSVSVRARPHLMPVQNQPRRPHLCRDPPQCRPWRRLQQTLRTCATRAGSSLSERTKPSAREVHEIQRFCTCVIVLAVSELESRCTVRDRLSSARSRYTRGGPRPPARQSHFCRAAARLP